MTAMDTPTPSTWLPPETPRPDFDAAGFRRFLENRAAMLREREDLYTSSDGKNAAADKAEECETILERLALYEGGK